MRLVFREAGSLSHTANEFLKTAREFEDTSEAARRPRRRKRGDQNPEM
jgi:hypothetical protein